jgi:protein involved in polysaccharide export with SLBB domain
VNVALSGDGTQTGLYATASSLTFALISGAGVSNVPVGTSEPRTVDITNGGTTPQTVTSVTPPAGPFTATGMPATGTVINPGQTVTVQVTFAPTQAGPATGSFTISGSSGSSATVALSGTAVPAVSQFQASPSAINFGTVPKGHQVTAIIDIANTGNQPATISSVARLNPPFRAPSSVAKGLPLNPGDDLRIRVVFTPTHLGTFRGVYRLTWTDPFGTHTLNVPLTGAGVS